MSTVIVNIRLHSAGRHERGTRSATSRCAWGDHGLPTPAAWDVDAQHLRDGQRGWQGRYAVCDACLDRVLELYPRDPAWGLAHQGVGE